MNVAYRKCRYIVKGSACGFLTTEPRMLDHVLKHKVDSMEKASASFADVEANSDVVAGGNGSSPFIAGLIREYGNEWQKEQLGKRKPKDIIEW